MLGPLFINGQEVKKEVVEESLGKLLKGARASAPRVQPF